uniref:SRCR domain-containing protein n=1 Tax=Astyanax mexicanus TaxID=7994 RepID=A0A3B1KJD0_ASTMX
MSVDHRLHVVIKSLIFHSGHTQARLMNGSDSCSGRVELQYLSEWGTVCDVSWDMRAASVLCAQLKCGSAVAVLGSDWFGEGSGRIWADVFDCQGNETHLSQCPISSWSRTACSHKQDAGVICSGSSLASHEGGVRLSGGMKCEGEVEVFFRQDWRRVLLDSWSESESSVVCRQLGCGSVLNISSSSSSSPEHSYMCVTGFNCSGSEAHLRNCSSSQAVNCSSTEQLYITCSDKFKSSIRLVGSGGDCAGRLEVFHSGSWGTVSNELWDIEDAQVVCRQLQCGVALSDPVPVPARFGSGTGPIWLNEVECEGNEASLWNCRYQLCGEDECGHKDDVGVVCSGTGFYKEIRLTEGCKGNLEVFYNGTWRNVCGNGMTDETASVICRELNCGKTVNKSVTKAKVESAFNWLVDVKCRKHDSTLWHCPSSPWGQNTCDSNEVAHITCSEHLPLRLKGGVGSCSGRLEVYHNAKWGSVCGDQWDIRDAQVVCRQLGCGPALSANRSAAEGSGGGTLWMNRVKCRGNEIHLWDCPHSLKIHTDCSHSAGVTCADTVRLVDGGSRCAGTVLVLYGETWATVCDDGWDMSDATVVCRELGCGEAVLGAAAFGRGEGQVWSKELQCRGNESEIHFCPKSSSFKHNCSHDNDVGLVCYTQARLMKGSDSCSGRVELQYLGEWGTVCDVSWDMRAASVLCAQLKCGSAVAVLGSDWFGEGSGRIWADVFDCQGNETHLSKCPISSWSRTACAHIQDAGVICSVRLSGVMECEGEVEVFFRQDWRRVLLDSWSESEASVVCRQLGCGFVLNISSSSSSSPEHSYMCVTGFNCSGSEAHLRNCSSSQASFISENVLLCVCVDKFNSSIRLVGSGGDCAGRLEVFHSGSWGTVSDDLWDIEDAQVVCRQLQCGVALSDPVPVWFGSGTGPIWLNEVECEGNEASLWNCRYQLCGEDECGHNDDVGVVCSVVQRTDPLKTPPADVPSIYPVSLVVLGTMLFLALVFLVVQNRVLRRGREIQRSYTAIIHAFAALIHMSQLLC